MSVEPEFFDLFKEIFTYSNFVDGVAGASGGISAITVFYPLNRIRTLLQAADPSKNTESIKKCVRNIIRKEGIQGFYRGWWGQIVALGSSNFIHFYCYNMFKVMIQARTKKNIGVTANLLIGAAAAVINVLATTPLWMVTTQLTNAAKKGLVEYKGVIDGLCRCYEEEGFGGLYKGLGTNLILVTNPTIHFFVYERVRMFVTAIKKRSNKSVTSLDYFFIGALAKTVATLFTYPLQVAQTQLRADRKNVEGKHDYRGIVDCIKKLYMARGIAALFQGLTIKLWQTVLTAAFQFMTYEKIQRVVKGLLIRNFKKTALKH